MLKYILCYPQTLHINLLKKFFEEFGRALPLLAKYKSHLKVEGIQMLAGLVGLYATIFFVQRQQKSISAAIPHALTKINLICEQNFELLRRKEEKETQRNL